MPNETSIYERLRLAQADMANPVKSKAVKAGARSYNYEVLADVLEIVTDALHAHGLVLIQGVKPVLELVQDELERENARPDATIRGFWLRTAVADENTELALDVRPIDFPSDPQAAGSKETYARRYALKTAFGLAGVDDDGEAAHRAAQMPARAAVSPSKAASSAGTGAKPPARGFEEMKALLDKCRQAGMDMPTVGSYISGEIGKKSTEFTSADFARACGLLEELLKAKEE
jgi:hypothetical protein